ncbi:MAG TPA: dTDP-4-amino-4,6-dideoxygalactose transaminase [Solirubrobacteraceae bacterium]
MEHIPFNRPYYVGEEHAHVLEAIAQGHISGSGAFTELCERELERELGAPRVLLTPSGTAALELAAMLLEIGPGDEVIMPSYTFTSTANAFVLRGAVPVFVDIRPDTLNLDERLVEAAITPRTRAIVPVHYAGVGCEMEAICELAERYGLAVVEDAAHAAMASHSGRPLGTFGELSALSFHETKNLTCGEGGALIINDERLVARAEILRDKGTNRGEFMRGEVDRYTWVDMGSSMALSDLNAAFLWAQLENAEAITARRLAIWKRYHEAFESLESDGLVRRPVVPAGSHHNAHMYYLLLDDREQRDAVIAALRRRGVDAVFHYVPLHSAPAGRRFARCSGSLEETTRQSERVVRLPLWAALTEDMCDRVIAAVEEAVAELVAARIESGDRLLAEVVAS